MNTSRLDRLAPLSGVLAVVGLLASAGLFRVTDYLPSGEHLVAAFSTNSGGVAVGGMIGNVAAFMMLVFAGWPVNPGFASAAGTAVVLGIGSSIIIAIGSRAGAPGGGWTLSKPWRTTTPTATSWEARWR